MSKFEMSKCIKGLFTLSVVLNVLLTGALAGMGMHEWRENPWQTAQKDMSPESRDMMAESFKKMHAEMTPLFADMRRSRDQLRAVLAQEQFDSAKFDQVSAHLRGLRQQMGDKMSAVTKEMILVLPSEDRQKMADHFVMGFGGIKHGSDWRCPPGGQDATADGQNNAQSGVQSVAAHKVEPAN